MNQQIDRAFSSIGPCHMSANADSLAMAATTRESCMASHHTLPASGSTALTDRPRRQAIRWRTPGVGLATGVLTLVVFGPMVWKEAANASRVAAHVAARPELNPAVGRRVEQTSDHRILMRRLGLDLAAQRCTLPQAVDRLATSAALEDRKLRATLRQRLPDRPEAESMAAVLVEVALQEEQNPATVETMTARLRAEFQATYGTPAPQMRWRTSSANRLPLRPDAKSTTIARSRAG